MCGIFGYAGKKRNISVLIKGLKYLEYRGYDSCGVAFCLDNELKVVKSVGEIDKLRKKLSSFSDKFLRAGIAHTRWATHGDNSIKNAHPHTDCKKKIALVHNGIIENFRELRKEFEKRGHVFLSNTDTEIVAHIIEEMGEVNEENLSHLFQILEGSFAFLIISEKNPFTLFALRRKSPLLIGKGKGENFVASDAHALSPFAREIMEIEEGEVVKIDRKVSFWKEGVHISRDTRKIKEDREIVSKKSYPHYMLKEIHEQPEAQRNLFSFYVNEGEMKKFVSTFPLPERIVLTACGTSWHACLLGKLYLEKFARIPTQVEYASEFRYMNPVLRKRDLVMLISQSGETADTLGVLEVLKNLKIPNLGIVNMPFSTLEREADFSFHLLSGVERGVAATKTFTSQITLLLLFSLFLGRRRKTIEDSEFENVLNSLKSLPEMMEKILINREKEIKFLALKYFPYKNALYLGRGFQFPIALEGALKLKEISYIHAEGYPAAEMKHGPLALVDENMPVVFCAPQDTLFPKIMGNMEEVKSRKGKLIVLSDKKGELSSLSEDIFLLPSLREEIMPLLSVIPLQLFAYYMAIHKGCPVDKPRNLAKSVTVE